MNKIHRCGEISKLLPQKPLEVAVTWEESDAGWFLKCTEFATREDVAAGEADFVGESLDGFSVRIEYCPYCAQKLG